MGRRELGVTENADNCVFACPESNSLMGPPMGGIVKFCIEGKCPGPNVTEYVSPDGRVAARSVCQADGTKSSVDFIVGGGAGALLFDLDAEDVVQRELSQAELRRRQPKIIDWEKI